MTVVKKDKLFIDSNSGTYTPGSERLPKLVSSMRNALNSPKVFIDSNCVWRLVKTKIKSLEKDVLELQELLPATNRYKKTPIQTFLEMIPHVEDI